MNITEGELLQAIQDAMSATPENPTGALTTDDLCAALEMSEYRVRKLLKQLKRDGRLETLKVYRENIGGVMFPVAAYKLKKHKGEQNGHS